MFVMVRGTCGCSALTLRHMRIVDGKKNGPRIHRLKESHVVKPHYQTTCFYIIKVKLNQLITSNWSLELKLLPLWSISSQYIANVSLCFPFLFPFFLGCFAKGLISPLYIWVSYVSFQTTLRTVQCRLCSSCCNSVMSEKRRLNLAPTE